MNIFFTAAVRGGRAQQPRYAYIVDALSKRGSVSSAHVADSSLSRFGETDIPAAEVLRRELEAMAGADIVVAELTTPSLGVGYIVGRATAAGKKVLALYRDKDVLRLSSIIKGDPAIDVHLYDTDDDIERIIADALV